MIETTMYLSEFEIQDFDEDMAKNHSNISWKRENDFLITIRKIDRAFIKRVSIISTEEDFLILKLKYPDLHLKSKDDNTLYNSPSVS